MDFNLDEHVDSSDQIRKRSTTTQNLKIIKLPFKDFIQYNICASKIQVKKKILTYFLIGEDF